MLQHAGADVIAAGISLFVFYVVFGLTGIVPLLIVLLGMWFCSMCVNV